ncbi:FAD-binding domain-containing protein [Ophiobolus disseminans]|uniref:FAD-binding domain-containing protein n=1 Tax=Ophiobolus disseminans TaxID=1469910 RepID=A0A6A6ZHV6_9PLEO|nr:FAD-binding domain-containing protein [Ophiobolus disseminans]
MRVHEKISLWALALAAGVSAQDTFESPDFNVTEALIENGINVSAIPELASLAVRSSTSGCSIACSSLKLIFGGSKVSATPPATYWSTQQSQVEPYCTYIPTGVLEVSTLVLLARLTQCPFAVKSGGHTAFSGASSIEGGITVDLVNLKQLELSADQKTLAVGPGNRWLDVYSFLTPHNLAVVGGRAASVGVGGLTLGGGISHHTNHYGLACDNIASYELVTAVDIILTISHSTFPDLYWALRGGGNNFGIVTTFRYETFPQGLMFSSLRRYDSSQIPPLLDAFTNAVNGAEKDTKLAHFISIIYYSGYKFASAEYEYFTPVDTANPPEILKEYLAVPPIQESTVNTTLANTTPSLSQSMPAGFRTTMWSQSFKLNVELMKRRMSDHFFDIAPTIPAISPSIAFQAFSKPALEAMQKKGGNALGLDPDNGPFFHVLFYMPWTDAKDDKAILKAAQDYINTSIAMAKELGAYNDYMYMPYSSPYQPVMSGYGAANVAKLKAVSKKYDPQGVFLELQPGYFKFDGAPYGTTV